MESEPPLRIDLVITELYVGGAERCLSELALALHRRGDHVRVASIAPLPVGAQAALVERLRGAGIEVHSANCARPSAAISAYRSLRHWFTQDRPDVVQTMLYHANVLGTLAARAAAVPGCVGGIRVAEHRRVRLGIERWAVRRMDAVVCVSESVRQFADQVFGSSLPRVAVIGNAIDVEAVDALQPITWRAFGWPDDAQVLLYVGRLHAQKGLAVLAQAAESLLAKHPEMRCLIVGDGPLRTTLQSLAQRLGPERFQLAGWRSDALSMIKACRLLVLPSRYEGMPNVILEAMAAGRPVAACRVEGVAELLGQTADQQTCPAQDPAALDALIDRLWSNREHAERLGRENHQRALTRHALPSMAEAYRQIYRQITPSV